MYITKEHVDRGSFFYRCSRREHLLWLDAVSSAFFFLDITLLHHLFILSVCCIFGGAKPDRRISDIWISLLNFALYYCFPEIFACTYI